MRIQRPVLMIGIGWMMICLADGGIAEEKKSADSSLKIDDKRLMEVQKEPAAEEVRGDAKDSESGAEREMDELMRENENLRKKVLALKREMSKLSLSFSALKRRHRQLSLDAVSRGRKDELVLGRGAADAREIVPVLDVNPELGMAVLGAGALEGLNSGLVYRAVRDGKVVATMRVVIVRRLIAGAKVLDEARKTFPAAGDRAVLGRAMNGKK